MQVEFRLNGRPQTVDAEPDTPLLWVLREQLDHCGTKFGCGAAMCGACTVHVDGKTVRACACPVEYVDGHDVDTIEGLDGDDIGKAVIDAWIKHDVVQCGWCQPGQCMSAAALLAHVDNPSDDDIDAAMSGNLCRCGTYPRIRAAIKTAAQTLRENRS